MSEDPAIPLIPGAEYRFTFQEKKQLGDMARDLEMWDERPLAELWEDAEAETGPQIRGPQRRKILLAKVKKAFLALRARPAVLKETRAQPRRLRTVLKTSERKIHGNCPVASAETVCCNLRTIDAVENCPLGCSYCAIQTFYGTTAYFDGDLRAKLRAIELNPYRLYHFGTGQSSDSLAWGNRFGLLDDLCGFAEGHPNVMLELKTKSDNIGYFEKHAVPRNVVISWSVNPEEVARSEEHFCAPVAARLGAARKAASLGIPVGFHFHPVVCYEGWKTGYENLGRSLLDLFRAEEVAFVSFGMMTFTKPVIRAIRKRGGPSRVLQMDLAPAPHGKLSYPEDVKAEMLGALTAVFQPWKGQVFTYLCMEPPSLWNRVFGFHYASNETFEQELNQSFFRRFCPPAAR